METGTPFDDQPYRFSTVVFPRWKDLDAMGVLNNAVYFTFFEQARWAYFRELGLTVPHFPFVLAETHCRFLLPVKDGESLRVFAKTVHLGTKSFRMKYAIDSMEARHRSAEGEAVLVYVDQTLRSAPMSSEFRESIARFEGLGGA